jgi:hypothetical protein
MSDETIHAIHSALRNGNAIPYLGSGVLSLEGESCPLPATPEALVGRLTATNSVPHKLRKNLTGTAQFIENFKHRNTVSKSMTAAFQTAALPNELHRFFAQVPNLPLVVHAWYDDLPQKAFAGRASWGSVQGVSQAEHYGQWCHYFEEGGARVHHAAPSAGGADWSTLLYQPLGSVAPARNYLVSDSDFVEVLTEIDIQTPIPEKVKELRAGRHFLFLGCRFATQLDRLFARQIMKRSSDRHWAVLPEEPTRNEARFLKEQNIERVVLPLDEFMSQLAGHSEQFSN